MHLFIKKKALAQHLIIEIKDVQQINDFNFKAEGNIYQVLTEEEAKQKSKEKVKENLYKLDAKILAKYAKSNLINIQNLINEKDNDEICSLLENCGENNIELFKDFIIILEGYGKFLNPETNEIDIVIVDSYKFYIFKLVNNN